MSCMSNTFVVIGRFAISFFKSIIVSRYQPIINPFSVYRYSSFLNLLFQIFFSINLQLLLPLYISFPFISCFAHKKVITLFLFFILFFQIFFSINLQLLLPLYTSFPFISCFAHKKVITLFLFLILFFLLVDLKKKKKKNSFLHFCFKLV